MAFQGCTNLKCGSVFCPEILQKDVIAAGVSPIAFNSYYPKSSCLRNARL